MIESKDEKVRPEHRAGAIRAEEYPDGSYLVYTKMGGGWLVDTSDGRNISDPKSPGRSLVFPTLNAARAYLYALGQGPASLPREETQS